jgi:serine/threonine protein kinase
MQSPQSKTSTSNESATVPPSASDSVTLPPTLPNAASASALLSPPQSPDELGRLSHYRVLKQLGAGGMGMVFLAEDTLLQRKVALKVMLPGVAVDASNRERFLREARAAAALTHDHVVTIHQVGEERSIPFLAMQLLQGESLDDYLQRGKKISYAQICRIGRETAIGLAAAHARGLVHRDIKPANLWLEAPKGRVKILDFGLARASSDANLTGTGLVLGTPAFMSPEQARATSGVDGRADLWSVGVVLYRLCTGRLPFQGEDLLAMITAIALDTPPNPIDLAPDMPPALSDLIMQLLAKDRDKRLKTAKELADRLLAIERTLRSGTAINVPGRPDSKSKLSSDSEIDSAPLTIVGGGTKKRPHSRNGRSRTGMWIGIGLVAMGLGAAAVWGVVHKNKSSDPPSALVNKDAGQPEPKSEPTPPGNAEAKSDADGQEPKTPVVQWKSRLTEPDFHVTLPNGDLGPSLIGFIEGGQSLLVVDAEFVWLRSLAGGAWRRQPYESLLKDRYKGEPRHAALSPDQKFLAVGVNALVTQAPNRVVLWDPAKGQPASRQNMRAGGVCNAISFASDSKTVADIAVGKIHFWVIKNGNDLTVGPISEGLFAQAVACSPTSPVLAVGTRRGEVKLIEIGSMATSWTKGVGGGQAIQSISWSNDGKRLAASNPTGTVIFNAADGKPLARIPRITAFPVLSPNGRWIGGGSAEGIVWLAEAASGRVAAASANDDVAAVEGTAFTPDGRTLITLGHRGLLKHWDVPLELLNPK